MRQVPVALDTADEIRELAKQGLGRNQISHQTGINASTVRGVLTGRHKTYVDILTPRQVTSLLMSGFGPRGSK